MDEKQRRLAEELLFTEKQSDSFVKRLYFGDFESDLIFPYPNIQEKESGQVADFLATLEQFATREIDAEWIDRHAEIPQSVLSGLGNLGVLGMTIPEEYGGLGMTQHAYCKAAEIIAKRCASTALFLHAHQSIGLKALLLFGTEEQKKRWLKPLAQGEQLAAFALTEPNAGSDASGIETRAVYHPEKRSYIINGKKQWITNGANAKVLTVMAKTEMETPQGKQDKVTAFLITPDLQGFKVTAPALEKVGMRGTKTANLEFSNMEVSEANVLGPLGGGLKVCLTVLDYGRTTFGATCTGAAKTVASLAIAHAKSRYQFGRPLASFGLVKEKIAKMTALIYAMEATTYLTAQLIDNGREDIMLESAILKVFTSEALWTILYDAMQIFGGRSFFTDYPLERMMRDARLNMIGEGSNEVLRAFIGAVGMRDVGLKLQAYKNAISHPKDWHHLFTVSSQLFSKLTGLRIPLKVCRQEAALLAKAMRRFGIANIRLLAYYREDIVERQLELARIADSAISLYTTTAVLARAEAFPQEVEAAKLYCRMAFEKMDQSLNSLFSPQDSLIETLSDTMTGI